MGRRPLKVEKENLTQDVLLGILKTGIIVTAALLAPKSLRVLESFLRKNPEYDRYYPSSWDRQTTRLWRRGLVKVSETKEGYKVTISDKGKTEVLKYDLDNLYIKKQKPWDGKWRMIIFDIPAGSDSIRHAFRKKLKRLGFFKMQKSVYVHPYPCGREIQFLREVYGIPHYVKLATVDRIENDRELRMWFRLWK